MRRFGAPPQLLAQALQKALKKWHLSQDLHRHEVLGHWPEIAGEQVASRSRPLRFHGNMLVVEVDHPAWLQELKFLKEEILQKIAQAFPKSKIKGLRFTLK